MHGPLKVKLKRILKEISREGVDCIHLAYDKRSALVHTAIRVHVSYNARNLLTSYENISF
jgi:hypothetical protein